MDFAHVIGFLFLMIIVLSLVLFVGTIVGGLANFVAGLLGHPWGQSLDRHRSQYVRPRIPPALRRAVLQRDGYLCQECGADYELEIDHVIPVSKGGATSLENLQVLCHDCNQQKSNLL